VSAYRDALGALGFALPAAAAAIAPVADEAWATAWQAFFTPLPIGRRFLVVPPWAGAGPPGEAGRHVLVIEPARAFGTGHHGSTESCLLLLERLGAAAAAPTLDIGAGSGILALAALALGAPRVVAIDVDPDAVAATRRNAELNGCDARITTAPGGPESVTGGPFPLVLANLLAPAHLALASEYRRLTAPGGALVLGGMLADEDARVAAALRPAGFESRDRVVVDGWAARVLARA
jgi:ribosomal protein L11 methyltransferase